MEFAKFVGTAIAIITPFNDDLSIDFDAFGNLIEHYLNNDIDYFVILGTTGENATLSKEEKNAILDFAVKKIDGRRPIVAGFGGYNTKTIIEDIKNRDFTGIDAILSVTPYYNKPNQRGLIEHYTAIADNSPVPVIMYNVPGRTSVNITAETTLQLAQHPNIIGIKEASGNLSQIMQIINDKPSDFLVISGDDALTLPMIAAGADGVISVVAMAKPKEMSEMVFKALSGDMFEARHLHYNLLELANAIFEDGNPAGIKAALSIQGLIKYNLRLPLVKVNDKTYEKIKNLL